MAVAEVARRRHGEAIVAVLFYGSCLRQPDDGEHSGDEGRIVDLYLLADRYAGLHRSRLARALNALLPPNVYYVEAPFGGRVVRAKYALVTLDQFERLVSRDTLQPYFWARFAQPTVILWAHDELVRTRVQAALGQAVMTMLGETLPLMPRGSTPSELWPRAFAETYRTELRAESGDRPRQLYHAFAATLRPDHAHTRAEADRIGHASDHAAALAAAAHSGQVPLGPAPHQGEFHVPGRRCLPGLEDRPSFRRRDRTHALAAASSRPGLKRSRLAAVSRRRLSLRDSVKRARCAPSRPAHDRQGRPQPWQSARKPGRSAPGCAPPTRCSGAGRRRSGCRAAAPD